MSDQLDQIFNKLSDEPDFKPTDAYTRREKAELYMKLQLNGQYKEAEALLKKNLTCQEVEQKMFETLSSMMAPPVENSWRNKAITVINLLQSDRFEETKKQVEKSGVKLQEFLNSLLTTAIDKVHDDEGFNNLIYPLLDLGAYPNLKTKSGETLLTRCSLVSETRVEELLQRGVNPNTQNKEGSTALHECIFFAHTKPILALIKGGIDLNIRDNRGNTALMEASSHGRSKLIKLFIQHGADANIPNRDGDTPLHYILNWRNTTETIGLIIEKTTNIDFKNTRGNTALMLSIMYGKKTAAQMLLDAGANPNIKNQNSQTPLLMVTSKGTVANDETVKMLLDAGANPDIKDKDNKTALDHAIKAGDKETVKLLKKASRAYKKKVKNSIKVKQKAIKRAEKPKRNWLGLRR